MRKAASKELPAPAISSMRDAPSRPPPPPAGEEPGSSPPIRPLPRAERRGARGRLGGGAATQAIARASDLFDEKGRQQGVARASDLFDEGRPLPPSPASGGGGARIFTPDPAPPPRGAPRSAGEAGRGRCHPSDRPRERSLR